MTEKEYTELSEKYETIRNTLREFEHIRNSINECERNMKTINSFTATEFTLNEYKRGNHDTDKHICLTERQFTKLKPFLLSILQDEINEYREEAHKLK